jgi:hypothetical protein
VRPDSESFHRRLRRLVYAGTFVAVTLTITGLVWKFVVNTKPQPARYPYLFSFVASLVLNALTLVLIRDEYWRAAIACVVFCMLVSVILFWRVFSLG